MVMIFLASYTAGEHDKEGLLSDISDRSFKAAVKNFCEILPSEGSAGTRRFPIVSKAEF
jgi:hypothetical protein